MKPIMQKAPAHIVSISGIIDIIVCPDHRNNWIEEQYTQGQLLDTTQFCNCCTDDCSDLCQMCNRTFAQITARNKALQD
jgi:hypothetical protein